MSFLLSGWASICVRPRNNKSMKPLTERSGLNSLIPEVTSHTEETVVHESFAVSLSEAWQC
jgi:hypothetical protein